MPVSDKDLLSIQEARQMVERAFEAQKIWGTATQQQVGGGQQQDQDCTRLFHNCSSTTNKLSLPVQPAATIRF